MIYLAVADIRYEKQPARGADRVLQLHERYPNNPYISDYLGWTLRRKMNQPDEALVYYARALAVAEPDSAAARMIRLGQALALADLLDVERSRELIQTLVEGSDAFADGALAGRVAVDLYRGDHAGAHAAFAELGTRKTKHSERMRRRALKHLTNPPQPHELRFVKAWVQGLKASRGGDTDTARVAFERALKAIPNDYRAQSKLAELEFKTGKLEQANTRLDELSKRHDASMNVRGLTALRRGQLADLRGERAVAKRHYLEVLRLPGIYSLREQARSHLELAFVQPRSATLATATTGVSKKNPAGTH
jgi:predicted Zn-dependent protease